MKKQTANHQDLEIKKQNQDFPNIPAASEKMTSEGSAKKEIKETSKNHETGKTDNTEEKTAE